MNNNIQFSSDEIFEYINKVPEFSPSDSLLFSLNNVQFDCYKSIIP